MKSLKMSYCLPGYLCKSSVSDFETQILSSFEAILWFWRWKRRGRFLFPVELNKKSLTFWPEVKSQLFYKNWSWAWIKWIWDPLWQVVTELVSKTWRCGYNAQAKCPWILHCYTGTHTNVLSLYASYHSQLFFHLSMPRNKLNGVTNHFSFFI